MKEKHEYKAINKFINYMLFLAKYIALIGCVTSVAVAIVLSIMLVIKGDNIPVDALREVMGFITTLETSDITNHIANLGIVKVTIAFLGYTISLAISLGLLRVILGKFKDIFNSIVNGNMYDATTLEDVKTCIPLSISLTFIQPIIIFLIVTFIGVFSYDIINVSGIVFLGISYIIKLLIENGNALYNQNARLSKEISDIKAYETELKLSALKKQVEVKKEAKKTPKKTTTKKAAPVKKEEVKKTVKPVKKTTTKKEVTLPKKKTTTKKTTTK